MNSNLWKLRPGDKVGAPSRRQGLRAGNPGPLDDYWYTGLTQRSITGYAVNPETAMRVAAVFACVRVVSETIAALPLFIYQKTGPDTRSKALNHPLYELLHDQPNPWQTSFEFREMLQSHLELRGNAYAEIIPGPRGAVDQLIPLHPDHVTPRWSNGKILYRHMNFQTGVTRELTAAEVFHLRGLSSDGLHGTSPISAQVETVGLSLAAQDYGARFFANDATPSGVLEHPASLTKPAQERIRDSWQKRFSREGQHTTAVLEEGMKYHELGLSNRDSQLLESRKFQAEEIARIFRVQPHKIGILDRATFSNIEHQSIEFVTDTMLPRCRRWEQAIRRDLILAKRYYFAEFNLDGLLRGDFASRMAGYAVGRNWGWWSRNDIRRMENQDPIEGGDDYLTPVNMQDLRNPAQKVVPADNALADEKDLASLTALVRHGADGGGNGDGG